jgi:hypothetical protein
MSYRLRYDRRFMRQLEKFTGLYEQLGLGRR